MAETEVFTTKLQTVSGTDALFVYHIKDEYTDLYYHLHHTADKPEINKLILESIYDIDKMYSMVVLPIYSYYAVYFSLALKSNMRLFCPVNMKYGKYGLEEVYKDTRMRQLGAHTKRIYYDSFKEEA